jgi:thioredoxin-related protein
MNKILIFVFIASAIGLIFVTIDFNKKDTKEVDTIAGSSSYDGWGTDYQKTLDAAKISNKHILMLFTGSDWCAPCKELKKKVFNKDGFKEFAKNNLELLVLDFPENFKLPESQKIHNDKLSEKYEVEGYPTVILMTSEGKEIRRGNYIADSPEEFIAYFEKYTQKPAPLP